MNLRKDHYRGRGRASGRAVARARAGAQPSLPFPEPAPRGARLLSPGRNGERKKKHRKSLRAPAGEREGRRGRGAQLRGGRRVWGAPALRRVSPPPAPVRRRSARRGSGPSGRLAGARPRARVPRASPGSPRSGASRGRVPLRPRGRGREVAAVRRVEGRLPASSLGRKLATGPRRCRRRHPESARREAARAAARGGGGGRRVRARGAGSRPLPPASPPTPFARPVAGTGPGRGRLRSRPTPGERRRDARAAYARQARGAPGGFGPARAVRASRLLPGAAAARRRVAEGNPGPREEREVVAADVGRAPAGGRSPEGRRGRLAGAGSPLGAPSRPAERGGRGRHPRGAFGSFPSPQGQVPSVRASARPGGGEEGARRRSRAGRVAHTPLLPPGRGAGRRFKDSGGPRRAPRGRGPGAVFCPPAGRRDGREESGRGAAARPAGPLPPEPAGGVGRRRALGPPRGGPGPERGSSRPPSPRPRSRAESSARARARARSGRPRPRTERAETRVSARRPPLPAAVRSAASPPRAAGGTASRPSRPRQPRRRRFRSAGPPGVRPHARPPALPRGLAAVSPFRRKPRPLLRPRRRRLPPRFRPRPRRPRRSCEREVRRGASRSRSPRGGAGSGRRSRIRPRPARRRARVRRGRAARASERRRRRRTRGGGGR